MPAERRYRCGYTKDGHDPQFIQVNMATRSPCAATAARMRVCEITTPLRQQCRAVLQAVE